MHQLLIGLLCFASYACSGDAPQVASGVSPESRAAASAAESARLNVWLDEQFEQALDFSPQFCTRLGDERDYDRLDDVSEAAQDRQLEWRRGSVADLCVLFDYELLDVEARTAMGPVLMISGNEDA